MATQPQPRKQHAPHQYSHQDNTHERKRRRMNRLQAPACGLRFGGQRRLRTLDALRKQSCVFRLFRALRVFKEMSHEVRFYWGHRDFRGEVVDGAVVVWVLVAGKLLARGAVDRFLAF